MYSSKTHATALAMLADGSSIADVCRALGLSRATIRSWRDHPEVVGRHECPACDGAPLDDSSYARLLGFYLGDGCISALARCYLFRVSCDKSYPDIIESVESAIRGVRPEARIFRVSAPGVVVVCSSWMHWPCIFPQDGDGPKHLRRLELADWQRSAVEQFPEMFLRGLFHSDGCRAINVIVAPRTGKTYSYPRWMFSNRSEDIHGMCQWALDLVGVEWKRTGWHTDVSKRDSVARLDELIGLKT